ncbi:hypothetical protein [Streptomyces atratus]|uniref:hypothetical protein n=1 Tax=Streptomyces atratus TaxID=1893 RepID=UPI0033DFB406
MYVSDSVVIAAAPSVVCVQLSSPTARGRRSPENRGTTDGFADFQSGNVHTTPRRSKEVLEAS